MKLVEWLAKNYSEVLQIITMIILVGEMITRLTPTKSDDGFMTRIGVGLDAVLTLLKVPNLRKKMNAPNLDALVEEDDDFKNP